MMGLASKIALVASGCLATAFSRGEWIDAELTAYGYRCPHCTGKKRPDGIGAAGVKIIPGKMLAADRRIPFGTKIYIPSQGWFEVQDRGSKVRGKRLDLAMPSHRAAKTFGLQRETVWIER